MKILMLWSQVRLLSTLYPLKSYLILELHIPLLILAAVARMTCVFEELDVHLCVTTPIGSVYQSELIARNCAITI